MRIISGKYKGRVIKMPKGIRPTQQKVRKAVFDILGNVAGLSFLELYAGSGAVGLEALSRGAAEVTLVESGRQSLKAIEMNIAALGARGCCAHSLGAEQAIALFNRDKRKFDLIFLDPPYDKEAAAPNLKGKVGVLLSAAKKTLQTLSAYDILAPNGFIMVQHFKKDTLPDALGVFSLIRRYKYGSTILSLYKKDV
jgi:16S rRNA (guanine(966)-N(2))-methyltransferase RsmD